MHGVRGHYIGSVDTNIYRYSGGSFLVRVFAKDCGYFDTLEEARTARDLALVARGEQRKRERLDDAPSPPKRRRHAPGRFADLVTAPPSPAAPQPPPPTATLPPKAPLMETPVSDACDGIALLAHVANSDGEELDINLAWRSFYAETPVMTLLTRRLLILRQEPLDTLMHNLAYLTTQTSLDSAERVRRVQRLLLNSLYTARVLAETVHQTSAWVQREAVRHGV
jgi:hypothetical protein